ncbi:MAG: hypothetical protein KBD78_11375 [Oligoflexales bacterium]|nr:hypothetical protein [Oligoflexales bacterium]
MSNERGLHIAANIDDHPWAQNCQKLNNGSSHISLFQFKSDENFQSIYYHAQDNFCRVQLFTNRIIGSYKTRLTSGVNEIDLTLEKQYFSFFSKKYLQKLENIIYDGRDPNNHVKHLINNMNGYIENLNSQSLCGFNDWKIGEEKEVTGRTCVSFWVDENGKVQQDTFETLKATQTYYDIYNIYNSTLVFGNKAGLLDGTTSERRPDKFNFGAQYYPLVK